MNRTGDEIQPGLGLDVFVRWKKRVDQSSRPRRSPQLDELIAFVISDGDADKHVNVSVNSSLIWATAAGR